MSRGDYHDKAQRVRREFALKRFEFRDPPNLHVVVKPSTGGTSPPVKEFDPATRAMIEAALEKRKQH